MSENSKRLVGGATYCSSCGFTHSPGPCENFGYSRRAVRYDFPEFESEKPHIKPTLQRDMMKPSPLGQKQSKCDVIREVITAGDTPLTQEQIIDAICLFYDENFSEERVSQGKVTPAQRIIFHQLIRALKNNWCDDRLVVKKYTEAVLVAGDYFQPGGAYHHLLNWGDDIIPKGIKLLVKLHQETALKLSEAERALEEKDSQALREAKEREEAYIGIIKEMSDSVDPLFILSKLSDKQAKAFVGIFPEKRFLDFLA